MTPASRAASHISSVLIAAGSPIGSSRMSTIRGSSSTTSGAISISCRSMPNCCGHLAGVDRVVGHRLELLVLRPEGDRVRVDARIEPLRQHGDQAGVETAAEERGHRDVGDQVRGDRLLDHRAAGRRAARPPPRSRRRSPASTSRAGCCRPAGTRPTNPAAASPRRRSRSAARAASSRASTRSARRARCAARGRPRRPVPSARTRRSRRPAGGRKYSGLMPSGSRARYMLPLSSSSIANANMPRNRVSAVRTPAAPGLQHHLGVGAGPEARRRTWPARRAVPCSCRARRCSRSSGRAW